MSASFNGMPLYSALDFFPAAAIVGGPCQSDSRDEKTFSGASCQAVQGREQAPSGRAPGETDTACPRPDRPSGRVWHG
jgi:hypothetical protein